MLGSFAGGTGSGQSVRVIESSMSVSEEHRNGTVCRGHKLRGSYVQVYTALLGRKYWLNPPTALEKKHSICASNNDNKDAEGERRFETAKGHSLKDVKISTQTTPNQK